VEQIFTCSPWKGPHAGAGGCLKQAVSPWGARTGAGSCQDLWTRAERRPCWSRFASRSCDPVGDPHWSSLFLKDCTPWERTHNEVVCEELQAMERTHVGEFVENCLP